MFVPRAFLVLCSAVAWLLRFDLCGLSILSAANGCPGSQVIRHNTGSHIIV